MTSEHRYVHAPRPLGAILPPLVRPVLRKRAPSIAALLAEWEAIVGPAIAAVTVPRRLAAGTLTLAASPPIALELQHLAPQLLARVNTYLGSEAATRLRFAPSAVAAPRQKVPRPPSPEALAEVAASVAVLPEGALRDALARLGEALAAAADATRQKNETPSVDRGGAAGGDGDDNSTPMLRRAEGNY
jgi:hypothetical protein